MMQSASPSMSFSVRDQGEDFLDWDQADETLAETAEVEFLMVTHFYANKSLCYGIF